MSESILAGNFKILKELGRGNFGCVFECSNIHTGEVVAVKVEKRRPSVDTDTESLVYKVLSNSVGFPKFILRRLESQYNIVVMEELGESLQALLETQQGGFSLKTTLMIVDQILLRVEYLHRKHFVHRDLKPENFLLGKQRNRNVIHMIDFGLSKMYRNPDTQVHIAPRENIEPVGNARFASINTHMKKEQSRADDLESIGYLFVYLLTGTLPWVGVNAENMKQKWQTIWCLKMTTSIDRVCEGIPREFATFLKSVRALKFDETPKYSEYRQMFRDLFIREGFVYDYGYDWPAEVPVDREPPSSVSKCCAHHCECAARRRPKVAVPVCKTRAQASQARRNSVLVDLTHVPRHHSARNIPRFYRGSAPVRV